MAISKRRGLKTGTKKKVQKTQKRAARKPVQVVRAKGKKQVKAQSSKKISIMEKRAPSKGRFWYVFQLSPQGEMEPVTSLVKTLRLVAPKAEMFVPAHVYHNLDDREYNEYLFEGYVFVLSTSIDNPQTLLKSPLVVKFLTTGKTPYLMPDAEIQKFKAKMQDAKAKVEPGTSVQIIKGTYRNFSGPVVEVLNDSVKVELKMKSFTHVVEVPSLYVQAVKQAPADVGGVQ